jgi:hypothetical protein
MNYKMKVSRRAMNDDDKAEVEERIAEIDADVEEKLTGGAADVGTSKPAVTATTTTNANDDDSDDSDQEDSFMNTGKAIVAEN